ncbi:MAG: SDR family oxidoreductase [Methanolinea sp.]|nr:SDR family oxidoreductase [Methanolinea sp.]
MRGPVVLVTGSTDGIGKATARALAGEDAEVILHGRDGGKGKEVLKEIKQHVWNRNLDLVIADFAVMGEVRRMAEEIKSRYDRLSVLVNNAGTYERNRLVTVDGIERTLAVNYVAPFILTRELLSLLSKGAPSRIVNVASIAHRDVRHVDWDNLHGEKHYDPFFAYALSKFADITFTYVLAGMIAEKGVTANCLHPGVIGTKLLRAGFPGIRGKPPAEGARIPVYLALSPEVEGVTGKYFEESTRPCPSSPLTYDRVTQERLWEVAEELSNPRTA